MSRTEDMIEQQRTKSVVANNDVVSMIGKYVKIIPKVGDPIIGLFIGEQRLREYTKGLIFVIQCKEGERTFISRDEISHIVINDAGFVTEKPIPNSLGLLFM